MNVIKLFSAIPYGTYTDRRRESTKQPSISKMLQQRSYETFQVAATCIARPTIYSGIAHVTGFFRSSPGTPKELMT